MAIRYQKLAGCLAALLLIPAAPLAAQSGHKASSAPAAQPGVIHATPALWVVKDRDTTIYLFGTVHLLRPGVQWLEGPRKKAFDSARELVLEIGEDPDQATRQRIAQRGLDLAAAPLTQRLPEDLRAKFAALVKAHNLPSAVVDRMKPWLAAVTLTQLSLVKLGYDPASGADMQLRRAALAQGKTVTGLETAEEQIGFFDSLSADLQMKLLTQTIAEQDSVEQSVAEMIDRWAAGDPVALAQNLNKSMEGDAELAKRLLTDRNQRWADWIKARLARPGVVFMAVGAGHLAGAGSVQDALKERRIKARLLKSR